MSHFKYFYTKQFASVEDKKSLPNPHQHFPARRNPQFAVNAFDVITHGVITQVDYFCDFAGWGSLVDQQCDFEFALGQAFALQLIEDFSDSVRDA